MVAPGRRVSQFIFEFKESIARGISAGDRLVRALTCLWRIELNRALGCSFLIRYLLVLKHLYANLMIEQMERTNYIKRSFAQASVLI